ncbi:MAG: hemerythrin domain-containing protein [Steroidobacteraceae bacterium]
MNSSGSQTLPGPFLEGQHHAIDAGVQGFLAGTATREALAASLALLREHIHIEEAVLFPPLASAGLAMPVFVMKREHGQMWPLIERLAAACETAEIGDDLRESCEQLMMLLNMHNPKEETILYPAADRHAGADPGFMAAVESASLPAGWRCELA